MLPDTLIRFAKKSDLQRMNDIYNWSVKNTAATFDLEERSTEQSEKWFGDHQNVKYPLYVAENRGVVIGWGSLSPFHPRPAYRFTGEFSIYIASEFFRQGIGDLMLTHLCQRAEELEYHSLIGLITSSNLSSLALAKKHGFTKAGHYREVGWKFEQWLDVIVVQKCL